MIATIWGATRKPVSSKQLESVLASQAQLQGNLYIGYPIIGTPEGAFPIDALLVSPETGLLVVNLVEGKDLSGFQEAQDDSFTKIRAKLLQHKALIAHRDLTVPIAVVTFAPAINRSSLPTAAEYPVCNSDTLPDFLTNLNWTNNASYPALVATIQAISTIRRGKRKREIQNPQSRGSKVKALEDSIANLDNMQSAAVVETFEGVQRIRGLAGSGKTIVLALKVAYLHVQHPDWTIAVTFNTRSLKGQFERLINTFVIEQSNEEPDWDLVRVIHAWGAPGQRSKEGIYYQFCTTNGVEYCDFKTAQSKFGSGREFEGACESALQSVRQPLPVYDAVLIDEAQDFSPDFLRLCYEMLKEPRRLVYAYDELQCLTSKSLPAPEEIFGKHQDNTPRVVFSPPQLGKPRQDIILQKCYRNSRPILSTAHALGFGIYRKEGLIQIFDRKELWLDIGYRAVGGHLSDGEDVSLARTPETSPEFLEMHSPPDDLIQFHCFETEEEQRDWLVNAISRNLAEDELQPDDIIIINPDPITTRKAVADARAKLLQKRINSNLAGVSTSPDVFFESNNITFTGIFRAKGNEAAMVYVINGQDCFTAWRGHLARVRNRLFTALTRSKAWVRVLGVGPHMKELAGEFEQVKAHGFRLDFRYPTEAERAQLNIINRDMSDAEKSRVDERRTNLEGILESLETGETVLEDYPKDVVAKLRRLLDEGGAK